MQHIDGQFLALEGPVAEENRLDMWGFIRRRKSIVIVLAIIGGGLGYFLYQQQEPRYRSFARMEVRQQASERTLDEVLGEDMLEDALFVIPSPEILQPAFKKNRLTDLSTMAGLDEDEAVVLMAESLNIEQLSPGVIEIQFDGPDPRDTPLITDAIAEEYRHRQMQSFQSETEKLKHLMEVDRADIEEKLRAAEKDYEDFVQGASLLSAGDSTSQPKARLTALNAEITLLDTREAKTRSRLNVIDEHLGQGGSREVLLLLIGKELEELRREQHLARRDVDPHFVQEQRLSESLLPWVVQAEILRTEVGPGHPRRRAVEKRIEMIREEFARIGSMIPEYELPPEEESEEEIDYLAMYRQSLKHELKEIVAQRGDLEEMAAISLREAHIVQNDEQQARMLTRKIQGYEQQLSAVLRQIEQTKVNTGMSGVRADIISPAQYGRLVFPILYQFLGLGGFLGGLLGVGLGYLIELADNSFRKPEEIVREFGVPILGHIPYIKEQRLRTIAPGAKGGIDRMLVTAHLPRSRPSEAFRSVRTAICFSSAGDSHRVIQVTSPAAGEGKTTLAANVAASLAQSGKRTILVESDFRRPSVHKITGVPNDVGIVDVLKDRAELLDVIQEIEVDDLSVLPCGKLPRNPSELLTRPEYEALLDVLRQKYEYVVVDTPPVLVVTDACSVGPRVDAVIVCMRLGRHTRDFGKRSFDQLRDVGAKVIGMVINGVEESDAYGHGSYTYSNYGRFYGNSAHMYAYADEYEAYFDDDEETVSVKRLMSLPDSDAPVLDES